MYTSDLYTLPLCLSFNFDATVTTWLVMQQNYFAPILWRHDEDLPTESSDAFVGWDLADTIVSSITIIAIFCALAYFVCTVSDIFISTQCPTPSCADSALLVRYGHLYPAEVLSNS